MNPYFQPLNRNIPSLVAIAIILVFIVIMGFIVSNRCHKALEDISTLYQIPEI